MTEKGVSETGESLSLEKARERLRKKGYLDRGVEGAVLKGVLAARTRATSLLFGAGVAALFLAAALAISETVVVAVASSLSVRDAGVLFLWLLAGALLVASALVGLLVGVAALRSRRRGDAEATSTEIAIAFGLLAGVAGVLAARPALEAAGPVAAAGVLLAVASAVFIAVRVARGVAFTVLISSGRAIFTRRRSAGAAGLLLVALSALALALLYRARGPTAPDEPLVVVPNARRVIVVGIDGWSDRYLSPAIVRPPEPASPIGVAVWRYRKRERDPAAFWTTLATGMGVKKHGVGSLDLVRILGVSEPVRPAGGSAWYLGHLLPAVHAARRESVTAAARRVPAAWEVAHRAGIPSLVVDWWTTYPAGEAGGTVLGNHLFFAARAGSGLAGEGWPPEAVARAVALGPRPARPPGTLERLIADAEGLDDFSMRAFTSEWDRQQPRLGLVYLPGLDILGSALADAERSAADRVALAAALTEEAKKVRAFLDTPPLSSVDLLAVILDGGRREDSGAVRLSGPLARAGGSGEIAAADVAPTVLAVLGVPASRQLDGRVRTDVLVPGGATEATVASWGRRRASSRPDIDAKEYVENLKSLGYLK